MKRRNGDFYRQMSLRESKRQLYDLPWKNSQCIWEGYARYHPQRSNLHDAVFRSNVM